MQTPLENFLVSCGNWENSFHVISLTDGRVVQSIRHHKDVVSCVAGMLFVLYVLRDDNNVDNLLLYGYSNESSQYEALGLFQSGIMANNNICFDSKTTQSHSLAA